MTVKGITYDAGAAAYDRFTGRCSAAFASSLLAAAAVTVGHKVLDVAAGTGTLAVMAAAQVGVSGRVVAADLSLPMLRVATSKIASSGALLRRGERAGKAGRLDLAEQAFRAAIAADPRNAEAAANLGITLANLGRLEEAQRSLEQSLALDDRSAIAHLSLGVVMDRQGDGQSGDRRAAPVGDVHRDVDVVETVRAPVRRTGQRHVAAAGAGERRDRGGELDRGDGPRRGGGRPDDPAAADRARLVVLGV